MKQYKRMQRGEGCYVKQGVQESSSLFQFQIVTLAFRPVARSLIFEKKKKKDFIRLLRHHLLFCFLLHCFLLPL